MDETEVSQSDEDIAAMPVGERLKAAREAKGISLEQVATETRVPLRHLQAIEEGRYDKLPAPTYALGFVKAYARVVGVDEVEIGQELRDELPDVFAARQAAIVQDAPDPARIPSKAFAWALALVGIAVIGGLLIWRFGFFEGDADKSVAAGTMVQSGASVDRADNVTAPPSTNTVSPSAIPSSGEVVITATDLVWVGVKDADKKTLLGKEMKAGESYTIPAGTNGPVLTTARPQYLKITVAGREIPPIGKPDVTVSVAADASSLAQLSAGGESPSDNATSFPGNGA